MFTMASICFLGRKRVTRGGGRRALLGSDPSANLIHGDSKEWATRHSRWNALPGGDALSTVLSAVLWSLDAGPLYGPYAMGALLYPHTV